MRFREAVGHELANVGAVNVGGEQRNLFGDEFFGPPCVGPGRYRRKTNRLPAGAEGILMERLGIDADQAFAYLLRVSQSENRKLIMICSEIV